MTFLILPFCETKYTEAWSARRLTLAISTSAGTSSLCAGVLSRPPLVVLNRVYAIDVFSGCQIDDAGIYILVQRIDALAAGDLAGLQQTRGH